MKLIHLLKPSHPRVMLSAEKLLKLNEKYDLDEYTKLAIDSLIVQADAYLELPVNEYKYYGKRMLDSTREGACRLQTLSLAYLLTKNKRYLDKAKEEINEAINVPSWNPSHFLDVAEIIIGLGVAYDWLFDELSDDLKQAIRMALIDKAFIPSFGENQFWISGSNNWNQVCHAGLSIAALAVGDEEPEWMEKLVNRAVENVPIAMEESYVPEGVYPEGPMYWGYGTTYNIMLIDSLESALGTDFGLSDQKGFDKTALYQFQMHGPDGNVFNYYDSANTRYLGPPMLWLTNRFDLTFLKDYVRLDSIKLFQQIAKSKQPCRSRYLSWSLLWEKDCEQKTIDCPPVLDYFGNGKNPVAGFRSEFDNPDEAWLIVKGGNNKNSHNHMDAGTFVFVSQGVRWVSELGREVYENLEANKTNDLWKESERYNFLRLSPFGHSTININHSLQPFDSIQSPIIKFFSSKDRAHAVVDTSGIWKKHAKTVKRGVALLNRESALIQDEIAGCNGIVTWQMISEANIKLDGHKAILTKNNKTFIAQIIEPKNAVFQKMSLQPRFPEENKNEGFEKIVIELDTNGDCTIIVHIFPESAGVSPTIEPLANWED
ncbi:MAG: heparinase II/III family protein [Kiritimatiellae bacterium]|jgi:hypothetical protein|nr:heparinase II/III family protein [Kiritimatiellia bacterium]